MTKKVYYSAVQCEDSTARQQGLFYHFFGFIDNRLWQGRSL